MSVGSSVFKHAPHSDDGYLVTSMALGWPSGIGRPPTRELWVGVANGVLPLARQSSAYSAKTSTAKISAFI